MGSGGGGSNFKDLVTTHVLVPLIGLGSSLGIGRKLGSNQSVIRAFGMPHGKFCMFGSFDGIFWIAHFSVFIGLFTTFAIGSNSYDSCGRLGCSWISSRGTSHHPMARPIVMGIMSESLMSSHPLIDRGTPEPSFQFVAHSTS